MTRAALRRLAGGVAAWPALLRDTLAAGLAVLSVCLGEVVAMTVPLTPEWLLAVPGAMLAWWAFGWPSGLFGLLVAAGAVAFLAPGREHALLGSYAQEPLKLLAVAAALIAAPIGARLWVRQRERRAALLIDACAVDALARIQHAEARLAQAEAETRAARAELARAAAELARAAVARDCGMEEARRREGGV